MDQWKRMMNGYPYAGYQRPYEAAPHPTVQPTHEPYDAHTHKQPYETAPLSTYQQPYDASTYKQSEKLPLNARGDLLTFTNSLSRLPLGPEGSVLRVNHQSQSGLEYAGCIHPDSTKSLVLGQDAAKDVTGSDNTVIGQKSATNLTSGTNNTSLGSDTLSAINVQSNNTGIGAKALSQVLTDGNTAIGSNSASRATSATHITAIGHKTLHANIAGNYNTAVGSEALENTIASNNTGIGSLSLHDNTTGDANTAIGASAAQDNVSGSRNVAAGYRSLYSNSSGSDNTGLGTNSLSYLVHGSNNTAVGSNALINSISNDNTAIGYRAGDGNTTGSNNLFLGKDSGVNVSTANNCVVIGSIPAKNTSDATFVANVHNSNVTGASVVVDTWGRLGITVSSKRYKDNIEKLSDDVSTKIYQLEPVTFSYKDDPSKACHYGLIAEQVYEVMPELVVMKQETETRTVSETRTDGTKYQRQIALPTGNKPHTVQYEKLIPLLLNEVIKLRSEVDELKNQLLTTQIHKLREEVDSLKNQS